MESFRMTHPSINSGMKYLRAYARFEFLVSAPPPPLCESDPEAGVSRCDKYQKAGTALCQYFCTKVRELSSYSSFPCSYVILCEIKNFFN